MKAAVAPLEGNKVKVSVEVDETEIESAIDEAFRKFARELRVPGFRPGKAPRRILEARIGRAAARQEALRDALPDWYGRAIADQDVDAIAPPEIDITSGAEDGPVAFDAVVEVRPQLQLEGYGALKVTVPSPVVGDDEIDGQVDRLRANFAQLAPAPPEREIRPGDQVLVDMSATRDGQPVASMTYTDYSVEVGSGNDLPELDEHLPGARAGDTLSFEAELPGGPGQLEVVVKEVQEKVLPEPTDEWASEASEFDTLAELRQDIAGRLSALKRVQAIMTLRNNVVDALVALVDQDPPGVLVDSEVERRAHDLGHRLDAQGIPLEQYLAAVGRTVEEVIAEMRGQAIPAVKADLALRSVAEAEGIEASEDEVMEYLGRLAAQQGRPLADLVAQVERASGGAAVRSDVRKGKALEWLVEHAEVVDEEGSPVDRSLLEAPEDSSDGEMSATAGGEAGDAEGPPPDGASGPEAAAPDSSGEESVESEQA